MASIVAVVVDVALTATVATLLKLLIYIQH